MAISDAALYDDGLVRVDDHGVTLRRYYFPLATSKHIAFEAIADVQVVDLDAVGGRYRIWGTGVPTRWLPLDTGRPKKTRAVILAGKRVNPMFTPDDPDRVAELIRAQLKDLKHNGPTDANYGPTAKNLGPTRALAAHSTSLRAHSTYLRAHSTSARWARGL